LTQPSARNPFILPAIWEAVCLLIGVAVFLKTENVLAIVIAAIVGGVPVLLAVVRQVSGAKKTDAPTDRSKDLVQ